MFEREIRDAMTVERWSIVRVHRKQNLAEHSFFVTIYANDLAQWLGMTEEAHLILLKRALWHDVKDEVFTGDHPGPVKRRTWGEQAKDFIKNATDVLFYNLDARAARSAHGADELINNVLKLADSMDEACFLAGEIQMGNGNLRGILDDSMARIDEWLVKVQKSAYLSRDRCAALTAKVHTAVFEAETGISRCGSREVIGL